MPDAIDIFDDLENHIDDVLADLNKMIPKANSELYDAFLELYYSLDKNASGNIDASVANLNTINAFKAKIDKIINEGSYGDAVNEYLKGYNSSSGYINDYFSSIVDEFKDNDKLYQAILKANINTTTDSLLNAGIDANFTDPITKVLQDLTTSGSNKADFIATIKANLNDETGLLSRYVPQVAQDTIKQFQGNYVDTISKDLGLKHYYYRGSKRKTSRPFCLKMKGKYFTEDQLKKHVTEESKGGGWQGMVKGENWSNFMIYRGGYNCVDDCLPISQKIYDNAPDSAKWKD